MNELKIYSIATITAISLFVGGYFLGRNETQKESELKIKTEIEKNYRFNQLEIKQYEKILQQLPNWDSTKFYDWSAGYECGNKWQMVVDDLKENYIHKDSCSVTQR